jgi:hypothetical protein
LRDPNLTFESFHHDMESAAQARYQTRVSNNKPRSLPSLSSFFLPTYPTCRTSTLASTRHSHSPAARLGKSPAPSHQRLSRPVYHYPVCVFRPPTGTAATAVHRGKRQGDKHAVPARLPCSLVLEQGRTLSRQVMCWCGILPLLLLLIPQPNDAAFARLTYTPQHSQPGRAGATAGRAGTWGFIV